MEEARVEEQVARLRLMSMKELKSEWLNHFEHEPPKFNRIFLERRLAYCIQKDALGGLKEETRLALEKLYLKKNNTKQKRKYRPPAPGSIITRVHNGIEHRVAVSETGYEYDGRRYSNLSIIARLITGTRWSGPSFFGLEESGE